MPEPRYKFSSEEQLKVLAFLTAKGNGYISMGQTAQAMVDSTGGSAVYVNQMQYANNCVSCITHLISEVEKSFKVPPLFDGLQNL